MVMRRASIGATLAMLVVLSGCAGSAPPQDPRPTIASSPTQTLALTPAPTPSTPPTARLSPSLDPIRPVLRLTVYEFPSAVTKIESPEFSLYADGLVIYAVKERSPDWTWPTYELHAAQLSTDQVTALLSAALDEAGLRDAREEYNIPGGDMGMELEWNYFDVRAQGVDKRVRVYGLGHDDAPDAAERRGFAQLASRLLDFGAEIEAARAVDLGQFSPTAYDAFLHTGVVTEELPVNADWPWPDLDVSDFTSFDGKLWRRLTPAQGEAVLELDIREFLIAEAPDREKYVISLRPLLPDEAVESGPFN